MEMRIPTFDHCTSFFLFFFPFSFLLAGCIHGASAIKPLQKRNPLKEAQSVLSTEPLSAQGMAEQGGDSIEKKRGSEHGARKRAWSEEASMERGSKHGARKQARSEEASMERGSKQGARKQARSKQCEKARRRKRSEDRREQKEQSSKTRAFTNGK
jgi:Ni/Co efflux regulator RcnB